MQAEQTDRLKEKLCSFAVNPSLVGVAPAKFLEGSRPNHENAPESKDTDLRNVA